jgi:hypothetical protein
MLSLKLIPLMVSLVLKFGSIRVLFSLETTLMLDRMTMLNSAHRHPADERRKVARKRGGKNVAAK